MFDLVLLFTGLCGFALINPTANETADALEVALVYESNHVPMLVVASRQWVGPDEGDVPTPTIIGAHRAYPLAGTVVGVLSGADPGEPVRWTATSNQTGCPTANDVNAYDWVIPMSKVTPSYGKASTTRPPPPPVSATVVLDAGTLAVRSFARNENDEILKFRFNRGTDQEFETALADLVEVRQARLPTGQIKIILDHRPSGDVGVIKLHPSDDEAIMIQVFNMPGADICCTGSEKLDVPDALPHFDYLSDILPSGAGRQNPIAVRYCFPKVVEQTPDGLCSKTCLPPALGNPQCPGADVSNP